MPNEPLPLSPRAPRARLVSSGFEKHPVPGSRPEAISRKRGETIANPEVA
jgi:hypothetical protein